MAGAIVTNAELKDAPKQVEDIPLDQINDLAKSMEEVSIRLCRRNERGQVATVYNGIKVRTLDLAKIDDWSREMSGGGRYRCEVKDPLDSGRYVMSPFWFSVEGPPRPPRFLGSPVDFTPGQAQGAAGMQSYYQGPQGYQPPQQNGYGAPAAQPQPSASPAYAPPPSPWSQGLDPSQRGGYQPTPYYAARPLMERPQMAPGATTSSDEVALRQVADLKGELATMRAESKAMLEKLNSENTRLREQLAERERAVEAERHRAELSALTARIEAMQQAQSRPQPESKSNVTDWAPLAAAVAPVLSAWISSQSSAAAKSLEVQQQGLQSLMQATLGQSNKTSDVEKLITTLGPLVMPLISENMKSRGPEAQAGLFQAMAENNLNSVAMMAQLIEAFASAGGKEEPWYLPMIKEALGGVVQVAQAYTQQPGGLPGQQPIPPRPSGALAAYSTLDEAAPPQAPQQAAPTAKRPAPQQPKVPQNLEVLFSLLPGEFQTNEWRAILRALHAEPAPPADKVAVMLTSHLEHLVTFDMVPALLSQVREHPRATLEALLEKLPVARSNPSYAKQVLDLTLTYLAEDGFAGPASGEPVEAEVEAEAHDGEVVEAEAVAAP
jgi:hypothetical protein